MNANSTDPLLNKQNDDNKAKEIKVTFETNLKKAIKFGKRDEFCDTLIDISNDKEYDFLSFSLKCQIALRRLGIKVD